MAVADYHIVFVQREAFMTGTTFFERRFKKSELKWYSTLTMLYGLRILQRQIKKFEWLKNPAKTAKLISLSEYGFCRQSLPG